MGAYLGDTLINNMYLYNYRIKSAYRGNDLVFSLENGVYIQDTNGVLYTKKKWSNSGKTANAIAVIADECRFIISLNYHTSGGNAETWSPNGEEDLLSGVVTIINDGTARKDYKGYENTEYIVGYYGINNRCAAQRGKTFVFPNGQNGYLASVGEWYIAYLNKQEIDECISLVSAEAIKTTDKHWASTQLDIDGAYMFIWESGSIIGVGKKYGARCRPFGQLSDNVTFA